MAVNQQEAQFIIRARQIGMQTVDAAAKQVSNLTDKINDQTAAAQKGDVAAKDLADSLAQLQAAGEKLISQTKLVDTYKQITDNLDKANARYDTAVQKQDAFAKSVSNVTELTSKQITAQKQYQTQVDNAGKSVAAQQAKLDAQSVKLAQVGIDTKNLGAAQDRLAQLITKTGAAISAGGEVLDGYSDHLARLEKNAADVASIQTFRQISDDAAKAVQAGDYVNFWTEALNKAEAAEKTATAAAKEQQAALDLSAAKAQQAAEALAVFKQRGQDIADQTPRYDKFASTLGSTAAASSQFAASLQTILDPAAAARATIDGLEKQVAEFTTLIGDGDKPIRTYAGALNSLTAIESALSSQGRLIDNFVNQQAAVDAATAAYQRSVAAVTAREAAIAGATTVDQNMIAALRAEQSELASTSATLANETERLNALDAALATAGIQTNNLTAAQTRLKTAATTAAGAAAKLQTANGGDGKFLGLRPYDLQNLSYQINDVITGLASGQPIFQIIAQQGGQFAQIPGFLSAIVRYIPELALLAVVFTTIYEAVKRVVTLNDDIRDFTKEINAMSDANTFNARTLALQVQALTDYGVAAKDAKLAAQDFLTNGLNPDRFIQVTKAAQDLATATGKPFTETFKDLTTALTGNFQSLADLDNKYHIFSTTQRAAIKDAFDAENADKGRSTAIDDVSTKLGALAANSRGPWAQAARDLGEAWNKAIDAIATGAIGRAVESSLDALGKGAAEIAAGLNGKAPPQSGATILSRRAGLNASLLGIPSGAPGNPADASGPLAGGGQPSGAVTVPSDATTSAGKEYIAQLTQQIALQNKLQDGAAQVEAARKDAYEKALKDTKDLGAATQAANLAGAQKQKEVDEATAQERIQLETRITSALQSAASGQDSNLGQRLDAVKARFKDAYDAIALGQKKLADPASLATQKATLDSLEGQALAQETLSYYEQRLGDLTKARADIQKSANDALAAGSITATQAVAQITAGNAKLNPVIKSTAEAAVAFGAGLKDTANDPKVISFLTLAQNALSDSTNQGQAQALKVYEDAVTIAQKAQADAIKQVSDDLASNNIDAATALQRIIDLSAKLGGNVKVIADEGINFAKGLAGAATSPQIQALTQKLSTAATGATSTGKGTVTGTAELGTLTTAENKVNELISQRNDLVKTYEDLEQQGLLTSDEVETKRQALYQATGGTIQDQIDKVTALIATLRGQPGADLTLLDAATAKMQLLGQQTVYVNKDVQDLNKAVADGFANSATTAFDSVGQAIGNAVAGTESWGDALSDLGRAAANFFADFLKDIAEAILKIEALKVAESIFGSSGGGGGLGALIFGGGGGGSSVPTDIGTDTTGVAGFNAVAASASGAGAASSGSWLDWIASLFHTGTGGGSMSRSGVSAAAWANAPRYHSGQNMVGLSSNEQAAILKKGEDVLTESDPYHSKNRWKLGQGGQQAQPPVKQVLVLDPDDINKVSAGTGGEQVVMTHIKANVPTIRQLLRIKN